MSDPVRLPEPESTGIILVRAWVHDGRLVARLQSAREGLDGQRTAVAVGVDEIGETVSRWLGDFLETPP